MTLAWAKVDLDSEVIDEGCQRLVNYSMGILARAWMATPSGQDTSPQTLLRKCGRVFAMWFYRAWHLS
jgi:hypothetical protein